MTEKLTFFKNSEWYDFEKFAMHMGAEHGWDMGRCTYYYNAMLEWSEGETSKDGRKKKKIDWVKVALVWDRKDKREARGYWAGRGKQAVRF